MYYDEYNLHHDFIRRDIPASMPSTHVLVVDDDVLFAKQVQKLASREGMNCSTISDIKTLLTKTPREEGFDVIIIDYNLIDVKGTEVASLFPNTPVVLISSSMDWMEPETECTQNTVSFVCKSCGIPEIIKEAQSAADAEYRGDGLGLV